MPKFRIGGTYTLDFVVEVDANDEDDAIDLVKQFSPDDFDGVTYVPTKIDTCIALDAEGNEINA